MAWQLRRATAADLEGIMRIEHAVFPTDAWSAESMASEISGAHGFYVVAFDQSQPDEFVGYAGLLAARGAHQADIQSVAVVEAARRRGLARTLVQTLIGEARERGAREVFLEVRVDNPAAQNLYDSLGFERIAVRKGYYQPDDVDGIVMRLTVPEPRIAPAVGR
jgi:ribosomal-protein-alanine N-acetyltransferase